MAGKRRLSQGACPDPLEFGDPEVPLARVRTGPARSLDAVTSFGDEASMSAGHPETPSGRHSLPQSGRDTVAWRGLSEGLAPSSACQSVGSGCSVQMVLPWWV